MVLYALLASIAVLLALILVLMPRAPREEERLSERPAESEERADEPLEYRPQEPVSEDDHRAPQQPPEDERIAPEPDPERERDPEVAPPGLMPWAIPRPAEPARLYFVLDDAGASLEELEPFLELGFPFTVAVLPHLARSREVAEVAAEAGLELMLHQPMEALNDADPGPGAIELGQNGDDVRAILERNLSSLPRVVGVNNHMGSRVTQDEDTMQAVLEELHQRGLFFLDSRTTHLSAAPRVAAELGIPFMERDVFLDHDPQREAIEAALHQALTVAETQGHAVMIGHVMVSELAEVFEEIYPQLVEHGYRFEPLSQYFELQQHDDDSRD